MHPEKSNANTLRNCRNGGRMIQSFLFLAAILVSSQALANDSCSDRLIVLKGQKSALQNANPSTLNAAKNAFAHYQAEVGAEPELRKYQAYFNTAYGQVTGYRFLVGAKNNASPIEIEYYADNKKKIVYAKGKAASSREYWICEAKPVK